MTRHKEKALQLETSRLLLRPPQRGDFEGYAAFMADSRTASFVGGVQPRSSAWRSFMTLAGAWQLEGFAMFSVIEKASGRWVGRVGPWMPEGWPGREIGWGIAFEHQGKGYATEAAAAAMTFAVETLGWDDVIHVIDGENVASQAVARKLGARNRGPGRLPAPYEHASVDIWGQTRDEWLRFRG
jgi:RimJ/RimL family protein N-acetyltransferase